jgi:hypothetical protein
MAGATSYQGGHRPLVGRGVHDGLAAGRCGSMPERFPSFSPHHPSTLRRSRRSAGARRCIPLGIDLSLRPRRAGSTRVGGPETRRHPGGRPGEYASGVPPGRCIGIVRRDRRPIEAPSPTMIHQAPSPMVGIQREPPVSSHRGGVVGGADWEQRGDLFRVAKELIFGRTRRQFGYRAAQPDAAHYLDQAPADTPCVPQPISQPHPSIMIVGNGEKETLRLVAAMPTPATCSPRAQPTWHANSTCCSRTARPNAATTTGSASPSSPPAVAADRP